MDDLARIKSDDPFILQYQPSELRIASEFLTLWLPFLSRGLCGDCTQILSDRIRSLGQDEKGPSSTSNDMESKERVEICDGNCSPGSCKDEAEVDTFSLGSWKDGGSGLLEPISGLPLTETASPRMSWADMAQEDELEEGDERHEYKKRVVDISSSTGELTISSSVEKPKLSFEQREHIRFMNVNRKKDFICLERVKGKIVNILEGLELHTGVFSAAEQKRIVDFVYSLKEMGRKGELKERTYSAPNKWMRGKGRITIQFGCCYNYAPDRNGNPPGILKNEEVDPLPHLFKVIIRRLVKWHVLPPTCVPDSCIVNIYEEGDCIPPHIDSHDFVRPFCTVSFLSECNIVFGSNLKVVGPGEFAGSIAVPLPLGSVLVLQGNGADVAKHCVPAVPMRRISITFRKMDETKLPFAFTPEPDLQGIQPLPYEVDNKQRLKSPNSERLHHIRRPSGRRDGKFEYRGLAERGDVQSAPAHYSSRNRRGPGNRGRGRKDLDN